MENRRAKAIIFLSRIFVRLSFQFVRADPDDHYARRLSHSRNTKNPTTYALVRTAHDCFLVSSQLGARLHGL